LTEGYPVVLDLRGRRCLVVGGGRVALGKARGLLTAGAEVTVVAPEVVPELADDDRVRVERRPYRPGEVQGYRYVVAATDQPAVNRQVFDDGEALGVFVNAADDPANCSVTLPAVARRGPITVAVSTGGASPALAAWLRDQLASTLGPEHEALAEMLGSERRGLRSQGIPTEGLPWRQALDSGLLDLLASGQLDQARALLRETLREVLDKATEEVE
jgi:siroheme synthase-like protein